MKAKQSDYYTKRLRFQTQKPAECSFERRLTVKRVIQGKIKFTKRKNCSHSQTHLNDVTLKLLPLCKRVCCKSRIVHCSRSAVITLHKLAQH